MPRKRFNATEKEILSRGAGTPVQWQNVTQWHPGTLVSGEIHTCNGWQEVTVINNDSRGFVLKGETITVSPGHIRARNEGK